MSLTEDRVNELAGRAGRSCEGCSLCCWQFEVPELAKPALTWCAHCKDGPGCRIYETRPQICRRYACQWLINPSIPERWQPRVSGMILDFYDADHGRVLRCQAQDEWQWLKEPYHSDLRRFARNGIAGSTKYKCGIVVNNKWRWLVLPDEDLDWGAGFVVAVNGAYEYVRTKSWATAMMLEAALSGQASC